MRIAVRRKPHQRMRRRRPLRRPNERARRRSTVREKVSFLVDAQPAAATPATQSQPEPHSQPEPAPAPAQPASETTSDTQPRRAGWWSRRFGNGE